MICATTLAGYLESVYLAENFGLSNGYIAELRRVVRQFGEFLNYEPTLMELSPALVCRFLQSLLVKGLSPTTINDKRRMLLTLWRAARSSGAPRFSRKRIGKLVEPDPVPTAWTVEQCAQIFAACKLLGGMVGGIPRSLFWLSLFLAIYSTGERVKAVLNSLSSDCDLDSGTLLLRWQTVKTRKNRLVWLIPEAVTAIQAIYDPARKRIWPWPHGKRHFFRQARRIIESAGVPCPKDEKSLFQRMRRTSGSLVEAAGGDGARHLGNSRRVFEKHYRAASLCGGSQVQLLPSPKL
jgi:integrase